jgi:hypothetical protein
LKIGRRVQQKAYYASWDFSSIAELRHVIIGPAASCHTACDPGGQFYLAHEPHAVGGVGDQLRVPLHGTGQVTYPAVLAGRMK